LAGPLVNSTLLANALYAGLLAKSWIVELILRG